MPKYSVPINFWGTIEAESAEQAWQIVYDGLSVKCGVFENTMVAIGMTDTEHLHDEVELDE